MQLETCADWSDFLDQWSAEAISCLEQTDPRMLEDCELESLARKSLKRPGVASDDLADLEARIGAILPDSYRKFLCASNGWCQIGLDAHSAYVLPAHEVDFFRKLAPDFLNMWLETDPGIETSDEKYFVYGSDQDPCIFRVEYLTDCIAISEFTGQAILLLNPCVQFENKEWEAMLLGSRLPGAERYKSFAELMWAQREWSIGLLANRYS